MLWNERSKLENSSLADQISFSDRPERVQIRSVAIIRFVKNASMAQGWRFHRCAALMPGSTKKTRYSRRLSRERVGVSPPTSEHSSSSAEQSLFRANRAVSTHAARRRVQRGIQHQRTVTLPNARDIVAAATTADKKAGFFRGFSWSGLEGKQGHTLVEYCPLVYQDNGRALTRGKAYIEEHHAQQVDYVDAYLLACAAIDTLILEDQPDNLWSSAVGELLARYAYGFERSLEDFHGPASDTMRPKWEYLESHRVDDLPSASKLAQAEKDMKRGIRSMRKKATRASPVRFIVH